MSPDLDKNLCEQYPKIFKDKTGELNRKLTSWGFSCGDGWYNIINLLCANIQSHIDWQNKQDKKVPQVVALQVKEKFGTLRFYYTGGDEHIHGMVRMAEAISAVTCEKCGTPGELRHGGWVKTLCDVHENERQIELHERFGE